MSAPRPDADPPRRAVDGTTEQDGRECEPCNGQRRPDDDRLPVGAVIDAHHEPEQGDEEQTSRRCSRRSAGVQRNIGDQPTDPDTIEREHDIIPRNLQEVAAGGRNWPDQNGGGAEKQKDGNKGAGHEGSEQEQRRLLAKHSSRSTRRKRARS